MMYGEIKKIVDNFLMTLDRLELTHWDDRNKLFISTDILADHIFNKVIDREI